MDQPAESLLVYTNDWCTQAIVVERFLTRRQIPFTRLDVAADDEARERLMSLNGGYASVPTIYFPDGSQLTEPSLGELREKLGLGHAGLDERIGQWRTRLPD